MFYKCEFMLLVYNKNKTQIAPQRQSAVALAGREDRAVPQRKEEKKPQQWPAPTNSCEHITRCNVMQCQAHLIAPATQPPSQPAGWVGAEG